MSNPQSELCRGEFQRLREEIKELNKMNRDQDIEKNIENKDVYEKLTTVEQSVKSAHHRIGAMEKHTEAVIKLSVSVDNVVKQISNIVKLYEGLNERTSILENKPAQTIYSYYQIGISALITGVIGILVGAYLTGG